jgi:hypothetical protein
MTCHKQTCWNVDSRSYKLFLIRKTCTFEYAAPIKGVSTTTYWQMTHIWWQLWKDYTTWYLAGGSHRQICIKPILSYNPLQIFLSKFYLRRAEITPIHYILARHVVLGETQQSWNNRNHHPWECMVLRSCLKVSNQVLKHLENGDEILPNILWQETQLSITEDTAKCLGLTPCRGCALSP